MNRRRTTAPLRRAARGAQEQLGDRVAELVRRAPEGRLERLMCTPVGRAVIGGIFWQIPIHLDRTHARGLRSSIRWRITSDDGRSPSVYNLVITDGRCRVIRGPRGPDPQVTITIDAAEFLRVAIGASNPMQAYFAGKLALTGDVMQAAKLTALFHIPSPRRPGVASSGR